MDLRIEKILNKERKLQFWQIFAVAATLLEEFLAHWHFSSDFATVWCQFWDHHIQEEEANTDFNADFVTCVKYLHTRFFQFVLPKMSRVT